MTSSHRNNSLRRKRFKKEDISEERKTKFVKILTEKQGRKIKVREALALLFYEFPTAPLHYFIAAMHSI